MSEKIRRENFIVYEGAQANLSEGDLFETPEVSMRAREILEQWNKKKMNDKKFYGDLNNLIGTGHLRVKTGNVDSDKIVVVSDEDDEYDAEVINTSPDGWSTVRLNLSFLSDQNPVYNEDGVYTPSVPDWEPVQDWGPDCE